MNRDLTLISTSLAIWGVGEGMFMIFLPLYMQQLGATPVQIGAILGSVGFAMVFMQAPAGYLADRIGPRAIMRASWVMGMTATGIMAAATTLNALLIGMTVFYMSSFAMSAMNKYYTLVRGKLSVERALTIASVFFNFGSILGPLMGGYLGKLYGLQRNFLIATGFFVVSTIFIFLIHDHRSSSAVVDASHLPADTIFKNKKYLVFLAVIFLTMAATYLPQPLTANYLQNERGVTLEQIGQLGSIGSLSLAAIMLGLGGMSARVGLPLGQALVGLYALLLWRGTGMLWYGAAYAALGGYRLMRAMIVARARTLIPIRQAGLAFGLLETVNALAVIIAPPVAGLLYDRNPVLMYSVAVILILVTLLINFSLLPFSTSANTAVLSTDYPPIVKGELNEPSD